MGVVRLFREPSSPNFERERTPADALLVRAARAGEPWAQEALFRRHVRMAAGLAHRLLASSQADVDDLVQDSFIQALQNLGDLRSPEAFSSWLGSIVVRTAAKRLRRRRLQRRLGLLRSEALDLDALVAVTAPTEVRVALTRVYERIDRFPPEERIALVLRRVEGLSIVEISDKLGVSLSTAKRRLRQAEQRLTRLRDGR